MSYSYNHMGKGWSRTAAIAGFALAIASRARFCSVSRAPPQRGSIVEWRDSRRDQTSLPPKGHCISANRFSPYRRTRTVTLRNCRQLGGYLSATVSAMSCAGDSRSGATGALAREVLDPRGRVPSQRPPWRRTARTAGLGELSLLMRDSLRTLHEHISNDEADDRAKMPAMLGAPASRDSNVCRSALTPRRRTIPAESNTDGRGQSPRS